MTGYDAEVGQPIPLTCNRCGKTLILRYYVVPGAEPGEVILTHRFDPHICPSPRPERAPTPLRTSSVGLRAA